MNFQMKSKKTKLSNKQIVALSAFLVLTLALSGLLLTSNGDAVTGYQVTQAKYIGLSLDDLKNKGSGWFSDASVANYGNFYVAFNVSRLQSNREYDGRDFGDWDVRFVFSTYRGLVLARKYPSGIVIRKTQVSLKDTTVDTCKPLLTQQEPLGSPTIAYQESGYGSQGYESFSSMCILLDNKDLFKFGFAGMTANRADFRWEFLGNLAPKSIKVTSPNGGEKLNSGDVYRIKWDSKGVNKVNLYLKTSPSVLFPIVTDLANKGFYDWKVNIGVQSGDTLKVRVVDVESASIVDESDGDFTVFKPTATPSPTKPPEIFLPPTQPNRLPIGSLLEISSTGLATGWSFDPDKPSAPNKVLLYIDEVPAGERKGILLAEVVADKLSALDLTKYGAEGKNHYYTFQVPLDKYSDGKTHAVYAFGVDLDNPSLKEHFAGSPKRFTFGTAPKPPELKPVRVSIPIILESPTISLLTGKSIWQYVTGYAPASSSKKTVTVKLSYDNKVLKYTDLTLRTGADVKAKEVSPGKLEITYTTTADLFPGELFKVNFEKLDPKSTSVTLDTALEDGFKSMKIKKSTSVVKET